MDDESLPPQHYVVGVDMGHQTTVVKCAQVVVGEPLDVRWNAVLPVEVDTLLGEANNNWIDSGVELEGSRFKFDAREAQKLKKRRHVFLYGLKALVGVSRKSEVKDLIEFIEECSQHRFKVDVHAADDAAQDGEASGSHPPWGACVHPFNNAARGGPVSVDEALDAVFNTLADELTQRQGLLQLRPVDRVTVMLTTPRAMTAHRRAHYLSRASEVFTAKGFPNLHVECMEEQLASLVCKLPRLFRGWSAAASTPKHVSLSIDMGSMTTDLSAIELNPSAGVARLHVVYSRGYFFGGSTLTRALRAQLLEHVLAPAFEGDPARVPEGYLLFGVVDAAKLRALDAMARSQRTFQPYTGDAKKLASIGRLTAPVELMEAVALDFLRQFETILRDFKRRLDDSGLSLDKVLLVGGATAVSGVYDAPAAVRSVFPAARSLETSPTGLAAEGAVRYLLTQHLFQFEHQTVPHHILVRMYDTHKRRDVAIVLIRSNARFPHGEDALTESWPEAMVTRGVLAASEEELAAAARDGSNLHGYRHYQPVRVLECKDEFPAGEDGCASRPVQSGASLSDLEAAGLVLATHRLRVWCPSAAPRRTIAFDVRLSRDYVFTARTRVGREGGETQHTFVMQPGVQGGEDKGNDAAEGGAGGPAAPGPGARGPQQRQGGPRGQETSPCSSAAPMGATATAVHGSRRGAAGAPATPQPEVVALPAWPSSPAHIGGAGAAAVVPDASERGERHTARAHKRKAPGTQDAWGSAVPTPRGTPTLVPRAKHVARKRSTS